MSVELEILDQLRGGDLQLKLIAKLSPSQEGVERAVMGLLSGGDVALTTSDGNELPNWQWRQLFDEHSVFEQLDRLKLVITHQGTRRIG